MKKIIYLVLCLCVAEVVHAVALNTITEGFNPGGGQALAIHTSAQTSIDTGYAWSGRNVAWGLNIWDNAGEGLLDMSGVNWTYDGINAWTVFGGDYVTDLEEITFAWYWSSTSGNLLVKALIQDANYDWFVSDDTVVDIADTIQTIDATTTTWKKLNSAPVIGTDLNIGAAFTPDLSKIYSGGILTVGIGTGGQTRLNSLTFGPYARLRVDTNVISHTIDMSNFHGTNGFPWNGDLNKYSIFLPNMRDAGISNIAFWIPVGSIISTDVCPTLAHWQANKDDPNFIASLHWERATYIAAIKNAGFNWTAEFWDAPSCLLNGQGANVPDKGDTAAWTALGEMWNEVYCFRLNFPVFKRPEYKNFQPAMFAIPANISSAFGKNFCTPA